MELVTADNCFPAKDTTTCKKVTITVKHNKQLTFKPVQSLLDPTVSLKKNPSDSFEKLAQNTCYSYVLSGSAKEVSNYATIDFYNKHVEHMRKYHYRSLGTSQLTTRWYQNH